MNRIPLPTLTPLPIFRVLACLAAGIPALFSSGCGRPGVRAELHVFQPKREEPARLEIQAEVAGAQSNLYYIWFADTGRCEPQESTEPRTTFQFADGATQDWVTVEIWQRGKRVAQSRTDVRRATGGAEQPSTSEQELTIEITDLPFAEPGGPNTRTNIAGKVHGVLRPDYRVVVYARDDGVWYIQPTSRAAHAIGPDHTWSTWTHTGSAYAAIVVHAGYPALRTADRIPYVGGDVLARVVCDGRPK
ncbi:hypothetical protein DB347_11815 [Opitutaceae bacterium EW11]|nr:hypothetical protein DB347_11815 [Opitutaceae bacterium EW11]